MSSKKNDRYRMATAQTLAASFATPSVDMTNKDRAGFVANITSGAPTGTFVVQGRVSFSPPATGAPNYPLVTGPASEWTTLPGTSQPAPAAGNTLLWDIQMTGLGELRVQYTQAAGTGTVDIFGITKSSG